MLVRQLVTVGALSAALVGVSVPVAHAAHAATTSGSTPSSSTCLPSGHDDAWPSAATGKPGRDPGVTLWHDVYGWHVRVTHNAVHDRVFSGEIATTGTFVGVHAVRLEKNDGLTVGSGGHTLRFRFNNYGHIDGFDFGTHCAPFLAFGFASDGHVLPTTHISIGAGARHPAHDPFVIQRTA